MDELLLSIDPWADFTLAEIKEMEGMYKELGEESLNREICQALATNFSFSSRRVSKPPVTWQKVHNWFKDKLLPRPNDTCQPLALELFVEPSHASIPNIAPSIPKKPRRKGNLIQELEELAFEARSSRDFAWYDVASFLTYRVLHTGDLEVRVRFSGFSNLHDEWVNVATELRQRSIPLEPSECNQVNVGDLVLCYRDKEDQAVYFDAHIIEIKRELHDINGCQCVFVVRYDHDFFEEKVDLGRICCRPTE